MRRPDPRKFLLGFLLIIIAVTFSSSWLGDGCVIRRHTGFLCPGCGGTRAVTHLFRGEWGEAAKDNLLIFLILAAVLIQIGVTITRWKYRRSWRGPLQLKRREMVMILILIFLFTVFRNLEGFP